MFENMISEKLLEWMWIVASIGVVIFGIVMLFAGGGFVGFLFTAIYVAMGLLLVRVFCESMLVAFKMYENNRRSLAVMEQMSKEQAATRQALLKFLSQISIQNGGALAPAAVPSSRVSQTSSLSTVAQAKSPESYADAMSSVREELQERVRANPVITRSKLGDWPGSTSG